MKEPLQETDKGTNVKEHDSSEGDLLHSQILSASVVLNDESSRKGDSSGDNSCQIKASCAKEEESSTTSSSHTGYSNENTISFPKVECITTFIGEGNVCVSNVINANSSAEQLVNNTIQALEPSELAISKSDVDSTSDLAIKSSEINSELKVQRVDETGQSIKLSKDHRILENPSNFAASIVEINLESPTDVAELKKSEYQCTDIGENTNLGNDDDSMKSIQSQNMISNSSETQVSKQVVSNTCRSSVMQVSQEMVKDLLVKGFKCLEKSQARTESEQHATNNVSNGIECSKLDNNSRALKDGGEVKENIEYFSLKSSKSSEEYDEVEKSDGSDSGIGSELIDEAITKSSDSSSNTSSDEFTQSTSTSTESWVTPCISFSEMSEIDFSGSARLTMPTFDDLTRSPCDVYATEKKQISTSELDETEAVEKRENADSETPLVSENVPNPTESDEDIDISSIDENPMAKQVEPMSHIAASLLLDIPSIPSTSRQTTGKSNLKRLRCRGGSFHPDVPAKRKCKSQRIQFDTVSVYYFPRTQGFTCVPSQGGSTLGMTWHHSHVQTFTLAQYALEVRRVHQRMLATAERSPLGSPESAGSMLNNDDSSGADDDSADSDDEPLLSDGDFDSDSSYTLQPVKIRQRRALLRAAGVDKIDPSEKNECKQIRISREYCGCSCEGFCDPEICACALAGIKCQVDRQNFPCGCTRDCCANPKGRIEFNPVRVHSHYIQTIMRMKAQKKDDEDVSRMYDYQQFHSYHPAPEFDTTSLASYYPHHHPQYLPTHHHHHHHAHSELLSNFELQHQMHSCYEPFTPELTLYNNLNSHEKMNESFTELLPSSYTGETFSGSISGAPTAATSELYSDLTSDSSMGSSYRSYVNNPYNSALSSYPPEEHATRRAESSYPASLPQDQQPASTEQFGRSLPSGATSTGSEIIPYDTLYPALSQNYHLDPTGITSIVSYEQSLPSGMNGKDSYGPSSVGLNMGVAPECTGVQNSLNVVCAPNASSGESGTGAENFGEIISKTMVEGVIV